MATKGAEGRRLLDFILKSTEKNELVSSRKFKADSSIYMSGGGLEKKNKKLATLTIRG